MTLRRAFVLHRRPYRNTSLLIELFTEGDGRLPVIARGAAKGVRSSYLQPFLPIRAGFSGKGEVRQLVTVEPDDYQVNQLHGKALFCGLYVNELLMRLLPREEEHDLLLARYIRTLAELSGEIHIDWVLRRFELELLQQLGFGLSTEQTTLGESISADAHYHYRPGSGFETAGTGNQSTVPGTVLIALQQEKCEDARLRGLAKQLLRQVIDYHLDYRPLKSRELFR